MAQKKKFAAKARVSEPSEGESSIILISDLHLTPESPHIFCEFSAFANSLVHIDTLYILGDLFEYWLGDDAAGSLGHLPTENILQTLTARGINIYLIPGNRDFLIGHDFADRTGVSILNEGVTHPLFQSHVLLLHGDSLCTDDQEHQSFRSVVNETKWRLEFLAKPIAEREAIAQSIRFRSDIEKRYKPSRIMDVNQRAVETAFDSTIARLMIHGHTHRPKIHNWFIGGKRYSRAVLGDWSNGPSWIELSKSRLTLHYGEITESLSYDEM